jgi:hypothetical protein
MKVHGYGTWHCLTDQHTWCNLCRDFTPGLKVTRKVREMTCKNCIRNRRNNWLPPSLRAKAARPPAKGKEGDK